MPHIKRRLVAAILGLTLSITLAACDSGDDPSDPTDGGTDTTEPVGS